MLIDLKGKEGAAAAAWKRVQDRHLQKGLLSVLTWRKRFYTMERNYGEGETMVQYLQRVDENVRALEELDYTVDAGRGLEGGMGAADKASFRKGYQQQGGGGKKKELDKCLDASLAGRALADPNFLVLDSGATSGMLPRRDLFTSYHPLPPNSRRVIVGSGDLLQAIGIGTITIKGKEGELGALLERVKLW
ncbi:hypothetical protein CLOP_g12384 [Closterium sp. NIES-67]|nr:hypothetical protein CLOP_g12384 [Closterium sp. NIES-67]